MGKIDMIVATNMAQDLKSLSRYIRDEPFDFPVEILDHKEVLMFVALWGLYEDECMNPRDHRPESFAKDHLNKDVAIVHVEPAIHYFHARYHHKPETWENILYYYVTENGYPYEDKDYIATEAPNYNKSKDKIFIRKFHTYDKRNETFYDKKLGPIYNIIETDYSKLKDLQKLTFLLFIIRRYRCNIFHGAKSCSTWQEYSLPIKYCVRSLTQLVYNTSTKRHRPLEKFEFSKGPFTQIDALTIAQEYSPEYDQAKQRYISHVHRTINRLKYAVRDEDNDLLITAALMGVLQDYNRMTETDLKYIGVPNNVISSVKLLRQGPDRDPALPVNFNLRAISKSSDGNAKKVALAYLYDFKCRASKLSNISDEVKKYLCKQYDNAEELFDLGINFSSTDKNII